MKADKLKALASDWLAIAYPGSVIVDELSVADWGGASVDVAAITPSHIVGVEVKGEGDGPSRLEVQGVKYPLVCREMWLLVDESVRVRCLRMKPMGWGVLEVFDGSVRPENMATKPAPEPVRGRDGSRAWPMIRDESRYLPHSARELYTQAPHALCGTLWGDELREIVRRRGLIDGGLSRMTVPALTRAIVDLLPMPDIHDDMIRALRRRTWKRRVRDTRAIHAEADR